MHCVTWIIEHEVGERRVEKRFQILTTLTRRGAKELATSSFTRACSHHRRRRKALMKIGLATYASGANCLFNCDPCRVCLSHPSSIRFSKLAELGNEMIFCDGCDVCVHQVWIVLLPPSHVDRRPVAFNQISAVEMFFSLVMVLSIFLMAIGSVIAVLPTSRMNLVFFAQFMREQ